MSSYFKRKIETFITKFNSGEVVVTKIKVVKFLVVALILNIVLAIPISHIAQDYNYFAFAILELLLLGIIILITFILKKIKNILM